MQLIGASATCIVSQKYHVIDVQLQFAPVCFWIDLKNRLSTRGKHTPRGAWKGPKGYAQAGGDGAPPYTTPCHRLPGAGVRAVVPLWPAQVYSSWLDGGGGRAHMQPTAAIHHSAQPSHGWLHVRVHGLLMGGT